MTKQFGLRFAAVLCVSGLVPTALALHPTGAGRVWLPSGAVVEGPDILIRPYAYLMASLIWAAVWHRCALCAAKRTPRLVDTLQGLVPAVFFSVPALAGAHKLSCIHKPSLWLDLPILRKTVWVVMARRGAY